MQPRRTYEDSSRAVIVVSVEMFIARTYKAPKKRGLKSRATFTGSRLIIVNTSAAIPIFLIETS